MTQNSRLGDSSAARTLSVCPLAVRCEVLPCVCSCNAKLGLRSFLVIQAVRHFPSPSGLPPGTFCRGVSPSQPPHAF